MTRPHHPRNPQSPRRSFKKNGPTHQPKPPLFGYNNFAGVILAWRTPPVYHARMDVRPFWLRLGGEYKWRVQNTRTRATGRPAARTQESVLGVRRRAACRVRAEGGFLHLSRVIIISMHARGRMTAREEQVFRGASFTSKPKTSREGQTHHSGRHHLHLQHSRTEPAMHVHIEGHAHQHNKSVSHHGHVAGVPVNCHVPPLPHHHTSHSFVQRGREHMRSSSSILDLFEKSAPMSPEARAASTGALTHTADHSTVREGDADVWSFCSPELCGDVSREVRGSSY
jgi:hypothetical protein